MIRIGILVCSNGLGHLRRIIQIVYYLKKKLNNYKIDIFFDFKNKEYLGDWKIFKKLMEDKNIFFRNFNPYPYWPGDLKNFDTKKLLYWHKEINFLKNYDYVISDNFLESLIYNKKTILSGSFLWHHLYYESSGKDKNIKEYYNFCNNLMKEYSPVMIVNKYFFYPKLNENLNLIKVGMLKSIKKSVSKKKNKKTGVLLSFSASEDILKEINKLKEFNQKCCFYADKRIKENLNLKTLKTFSYEKNSFANINGIIGYAGMGLITEAIGTKTPLFVLPSKNPEINHNSIVLEKLKVGKRVLSIDKGIEEILKFYKGKNYFKYLKRVEKIDKNGIKDTINFILKYIKEN